MLMRLRKVRLSTLVYALLALAVLLPMLKPGYILTLDMVWTPKLPLPTVVDNTYLFRLFLHALDIFLPSQLIQKAMLFLILFLSGIGMHSLVRMSERLKGSKVKVKSELPAYFAGLLYMMNPFTYSRFMAGQYLVLLAYALMPFFVRALIKFIEEPSLKKILQAAGWAFLIANVSIHAIGMLAIVGGVGLGFGVWFYGRKDRAALKRLLGYGLLGAVIFLVANSFWLVRVLNHGSLVSQSIESFDDTNRQVFATLGSGQFGSLLKVAGLQGFWADARGLYKPLQLLGPIQLLALPLLLGLVGYGAVHGLRGRVRLTTFFIMVIVCSAILAVGTTGVLAPINRWLVDHVPLFAGYREPQKFVGLMALGYAWLGAQGVRSLLVDKAGVGKKFKQLQYSGALAICLVLPLLYAPTMLWGFNGQLRPRQYPAEWSRLNATLDQDKSDFKVLFLPWHQYMSFAFSRRIIANPADRYFDKPVIVSTNPELGNLKDSHPTALNSYVEKSVLPYINGPGLPARLLKARIKYVILEKELDYAQYKGIESQNGIKIMEDTPSYTLYRNEAMK